MKERNSAIKAQKYQKKQNGRMKVWCKREEERGT